MFVWASLKRAPLAFCRSRVTRGINPPKPLLHAARTNRFVAELAAMLVLDPRSPREIMDDLNALSSSSIARP